MVINHETLKNLKPRLDIIAEIKEMLAMKIAVTPASDLLTSLLTQFEKQIDDVKLNNQNEEIKIDLHNLKWACILIKSFDLEQDSVVTGMIDIRLIGYPNNIK